MLQCTHQLPRLQYVAALILLLAGCSSAVNAGEAPTPTLIPAPEISAKPTYEVQRGEVIRTFEFSARVLPVEQAELFFRVDGRVRTVYVERGDQVEAGQVLADLENLQDLEVQRTYEELALRRAEIALEVAQLTLQHTLDTVPSYSEDYEYLVGLDKHGVELAQIDYDEMRLRAQDLDSSIADAQLTAPIDGVVISMNIKEGVPVEAYAGMMLVAEVTRLELGAELTDLQMQSLTENMPVIVTHSSQPGVGMTGVIRSLPYPYGGGAETDDQPVRITLDNEIDLDLNANVTVTIVLERREDTLWLPIEAIRVFERRKFVVIQDGSVQRRVDITTGIEGEDRIEIVEGLDEGQIVIGQ